MIRSLSVGKAHDHVNVSIRMLKIWDFAIFELLSTIFNNCLNQSKFSDIWKRSNIWQFTKKLIRNQLYSYTANQLYRPVSLLPIYEKIRERLIFNSLHEYVEETKLMNTSVWFLF